MLTSSLLTLLVLAGGAQTVVRVRKCSRILGCSCLCRTHFRLSQQGVRGCAICRPQWDEAVKGWNELSMVGQSQEEGFWKDREVSTTVVGAYQTVPRLQDRTAERDWWISICFVCSVFQGSLLCDRPVSDNNRLLKIASQIFLIFLILKNKATAASFRRQKIHSPSQFPSLFLSSLESFSAKLGEHVALWFALTPSSLKWFTEKKNPKSLPSLQYAQRDITNFTAPYVAIFLSMYTL